MTLTDLLLPTYRNMLRMLAGLLDKAEAERGEAGAEALLSARLAADMFPLNTQLLFAAYQAQEACFRLQGQAIPDHLQALAAEARSGAVTAGALGAARARIAEALAFLDTVQPGALDAHADRPVALELPNGMIFDMNGAAFARDWALPQFSFHVLTAYAILRKEGVAIGKADYVPHMFAYLRPGTAPQPG
jgi:hypothetical protein